MDAEGAPPPTLAAVRRVRERRDALVRRLRPTGLVVLAVVLVVASQIRPGPGLHGDSLGILIALCSVAAGAVATLGVGKGPGGVQVAFLALLVLGSAALAWLQPRGPGALGFVIAVAATLRIMPGRRALLISGASIAAASLAVLLAADLAARHGAKPNAAGVVVAFTPAVICLIVWLSRRLSDGSYQVERLLIELEHAQDAEVRAAILAERQRLAREMHDVLAHSLSGLALQLEGARLLAIGTSNHELADTIERAHHLAKSGLREARSAISMLRDEELPGTERLVALAAEFEGDSGVLCAFTVCGDQRELDAQAQLTLYRVAQEAFTNILKHARAERVELRLGYEPQGARLTVEDFGREQSPLAIPAVGGADGDGGCPVGGDDGRGYGLTGMQERAELLGGKVTATPTKTGFRVELWLPG